MADEPQEIAVDFVGDQLVFRQPSQVMREEDEESEDEDEAEETSQEQEDEEEEEEEEQDLDEVGDLPDMHSFEGPATWDEVDLKDLERVMLSVTSKAMPSTDNKEIASRLAMQAAALEAENSDPLGLGQIDSRQINLMRMDSSARKVYRTGRFWTQESRRRSSSKRHGTEAGRQENSNTFRREPLVNQANMHEMRAKALPYSESFDPEVFLGTFHANTALPELVRGKHNLKNEVSERTGQLKALVKENFDRFISCKNTIDDIHKRLRKSEAHDSLSASGNSTADLVIAISEVHEEAKKAFANLLDRAATSDQVKSVVLLLKRYESLFQLPSRIRQSIERGECDQAISEYRKARSLMDSVGMPSTVGTTKPHSIWHRLFAEAEQVINSLVEQLREVLGNTATPQLEALDAMRYVLQLQFDRVPSALDILPFTMYIVARETRLKGEIEECTAKYRDTLISLQEKSPYDARNQSIDERPQEVTSRLRLTMPTPFKIDSTATLWAVYVKELTSLIAKDLPDFWHAPQDKLNQIKALPGVQTKLQAGVELGLQIAEDTLNDISEKLKLALQELVQEERLEFFLAALRDIISLFVSFRRTTTPPFVAACLQSILETATMLTVEQMVYRTKQVTESIAEHEDFEIVASSHKAGLPASRVPGMLREIVTGSMTQLESVIKEAQRADSDAQNFNPIGDHGSNLRRGFFDCFSSYAIAIGQLWSSITSSSAPRAGDRYSADLKLLVLHSNCVHTRTHILKELSTKYSDLLCVDDGGQETRQLMAEAVEDIKAVEGRFAKTYIESRVDLLNNMLDEYFEEDGTDWSHAPLPLGLRDSTYEVINTLVSVQAELYGNAVNLQRRVMDELLQHLFSAYNTFLSERLKECSVGGILQLMLELQYFSQALRPVLRPPRDQLLDQAMASVAEKVDQLADTEEDALFDELDSWCDTVQGGNMGGRAELVAKFRSKDIINVTRMNVASFKV